MVRVVDCHAGVLSSNPSGPRYFPLGITSQRKATSFVFLKMKWSSLECVLVVFPARVGTILPYLIKPRFTWVGQKGRAG